VLTEAEIDAFWTDGFVRVDDVFPDEDVEELRALTADPSIQRELAKRRASERTVHLIPLTTRLAGFKELACDLRLTGRVAQLIGDDIQLSNSKLATKPPTAGAGAFPWHQDFAYYTHTNFDLLTVAVALDDVTPENGGMYAVRGSHRLGLLDHSRDGWMTGGCVESHHWETQQEAVVPLMSKAGGITIHHCLTLHGSPVNRSGMPRRLVVFQYRAGDCYQLADNVWEDTGFQVHGTPGHRVRCVPMDIVLPRNRGWERFCGEPHGSVYRQIGSRARDWNNESLSAVDVEGKG
jgi:hypothetical protein